MRARKNLVGMVDAFRGKKVLVVGDLMLDRYICGSVSRISPEAPVPVVQVTQERDVPGGAANVALNIQALGGQAIVAGVVGSDQSGRELLALLQRQKISTEGVLVVKDFVTTVKTRVLAERQQVVRVDREMQVCMSSAERKRFCSRIASIVGKVAGVVIEDYGKGVVHQPVVDAVLDGAHRHGALVGLDPNYNHELQFRGITLATPNYREACASAGVPETDLKGDLARHPTLREVARRLHEKWQLRVLMITLGPHGIYLSTQDGKILVAPTEAREVYDVSGAGDTVIATAMLTLATGAQEEDVVTLSNHAAGVVVGKLGTATCSPEELRASLRRIKPGHARTRSGGASK